MGLDKVIIWCVWQGLFYIGCSVGFVVVGLIIEVVSLMDFLDIVLDLKDYIGLGLIELVVIFYVLGSIFQFFIEIIVDMVWMYGECWFLCFLWDGQVFWIEDGEVRLLN